MKHRQSERRSDRSLRIARWPLLPSAPAEKAMRVPDRRREFFRGWIKVCFERADLKKQGQEGRADERGNSEVQLVLRVPTGFGDV